jgi:TMEM175 potassium channel family protein
MAEPESLATDEALAAHVARHAYDRLLMLSDGIFAIATTLAALEIQLPTGATLANSGSIQFWSPFLTYLISFGVIAVFWLGSRDLFSRVARVTGPLTVLTLAMLCLVALIPFGVRTMTGHPTDLLFRVYTVIMFTSGLVNAALWTYASMARGVMKTEVPKADRWGRCLGSLAMPLLFLPLLFSNSHDFVRVLVPTALFVGIGRRVILPQALPRFLPEKADAHPATSGAAD